MFNVTFYIFNKKENSTKQPDANVTKQEYSCILKEPSGILNPTIAINMGLSSNPSQYNYCHIPTFNRYYYINEWSFENGLWYASLSVDVLATYKTEIGDSDFYILRSSAESNGRVMDTKYPTLAQPSSYMDDIGVVTVSKADGSYPGSYPNYFNTPIANGYYYLGIVGANGTGVNWYMLDANGFNTLANALFNYVPTDMSDVSSGVAKVLADPMQFIVNCYWLPFAVPNKLIASRTIKLGYYSIDNVMSAQIDPVADICKCSASFNIRKHPQASSRGLYLNNNPFSNYTIQFNPFGSFNLDASLMIDDSSLTCDWYIDFTTGIADLTIKSINSLMSNIKSQMGVPVQLNQALVDYLGGLSSLASSSVDIGAGILRTALGDVAGGVGSIASGVIGGYMGVTQAKQPKITSLGGGGNFLPFNTYKPKIYSDFYNIANEFNAEVGRPLCEVRKPKNIPGYMVILDGTLSASATRDELQQVNNYLMGGYYYE